MLANLKVKRIFTKIYVTSSITLSINFNWGQTCGPELNSSEIMLNRKYASSIRSNIGSESHMWINITCICCDHSSSSMSPYWQEHTTLWVHGFLAMQQVARPFYTIVIVKSIQRTTMHFIIFFLHCAIVLLNHWCCVTYPKSARCQQVSTYCPSLYTSLEHDSPCDCKTKRHSNIS